MPTAVIVDATLTRAEPLDTLPEGDERAPIE